MLCQSTYKKVPANWQEGFNQNVSFLLIKAVINWEPGHSINYQFKLSRWSFYFPSPDAAASCIINETFKVLSWPIYIFMPNYFVYILKGDSRVGHHIGSNRMHPGRSFCLSLSANDQVVCTFLEQMLKSAHSTVHALELVPASIILRAGTGWYKP